MFYLKIKLYSVKKEMAEEAVHTPSGPYKVCTLYGRRIDLRRII